MSRKRLVFGVGVNDVDYNVTSYVNGVRVRCPYYVAWTGMLGRAYDDKLRSIRPTYWDVTVCDEWYSFSAFREWMAGQDWQGKELDKDILFLGNKVYSPDTCVFVESVVNSFTVDGGAVRGEWPLGVNLNKQNGKFKSSCRNPFTKKQEYLGYFDCPQEAHLVWKKRKHELACQLADLQTDQRVAEALRIRYK